MDTVTSFNFPAAQEFRPQKALRWGIIGTGWIVTMWVPTVQKNSNQIVAAVASKDLGRAQKFATEYGIERAYGSYQELCDAPDIDAIYIASLPGEHAAHAIMAMRAGKDVLIEKPLTLDHDEAKQVFAVANETGRLVMEAMWTKYLPHMSVARQLVQSGVIGEVQLASATFCQNNLAVDRLWRFGAGSELIDMGIYPITFLHQFLGQPDSIKSQAVVLPTGVDAEVMSVMSYAGNRQGNFIVSARTSMPTVAAISGNEGSISFGDPFFTPTNITLHGNSLGDSGATWTSPDGLKNHEGLVYQVKAFAEYAEQGLKRSPIHGEQDTMENLETTFAIANEIGVKFQ